MLMTSELSVKQKAEIEILDNKLQAKLSNGIMNIQSVLGKMQEVDNMIEDYLMPPELLKFNVTDNTLMTNYEDKSFCIHNNALSQLSTKYNVPGKYLKDMSRGKEWEQDLAVKILNEHSVNAKQDELLVRTVGGQVRGVLSNTYDRYSSFEVYKSFLEGAESWGGTVICDAHHDDLTGYIEIVDRNIIPLRLKDDEVTYVVMGAQIRNSDFGCRALDVKVFFMQVICMNGMTGQSLVRRIHRGSAIQTTNIRLSNEALRADAHARALMVRDCMTNVFDPLQIEKQINVLEQQAGHEVNIQREIKKLPKLGVHKSEIELLEGKLMDANPEDGIIGGNTMWKLTQGISAVANTVECATRKRDLCDIAGGLLNRIKVEV